MLRSAGERQYFSQFAAGPIQPSKGRADLLTFRAKYAIPSVPQWLMLASRTPMIDPSRPPHRLRAGTIAEQAHPPNASMRGRHRLKPENRPILNPRQLATLTDSCAEPVFLTTRASADLKSKVCASRPGHFQSDAVFATHKLGRNDRVEVKEAAGDHQRASNEGKSHEGERVNPDEREQLNCEAHRHQQAGPT
jgi:hypothetical protein